MLASLARRLVIVVALAAQPVAAQREPLALGISAMDARDLPTARLWLEQAVKADPDGYEPNWRLAMVLVDQGRLTPDDVPSAARDTLYRLAESYARRAVEANPNAADGHFVLATAMGQASLTMSKRDRVERATEIRISALRAVQIDTTHSGAWHVLGRWHAEIQRLNGVEKFFARAFLGAEFFDVASWEAAEDCLRRAVAYDPNRIVHRLDLAEVFIDRRNWAAAREQLEVVARLPVVDPLDQRHQRRAAELAVSVNERLER
ncbi:MAG: tetratricopeptide repeat protein [Gemmatimonadales bacterium]|nr:tetratricopeptide repeat protein [Gemmatimonadales bacterium]